MSGLSAAAINWFESRGIDADTAIAMGIFTGHRVTTGDESAVEPDANGNIIVFPVIDGGKIVAEKYRMHPKKFFQRAGGRKTFYNADILDSKELEAGDYPLVITEGEMDALAFIQAGFHFVVSVPDGAPPARDGSGNIIEVPEDASDIDPENDDKFKFIATNWKRLERIKTIIVATDNDEPGVRLAAELVRRLGRVRCYFVTFPDGCKDANDVLVKFGSAELLRVLAAAKPYPVSGVYRYSDLPPEPAIETVTTGWHALDDNLKLYRPALMVVTGRAGEGKTTWTQQLVANLATIHGWTTAIASFEMRLKPFVTEALASAHIGKSPQFWDYRQQEAANKFLEDYFCFIAPEPECSRTHDVDWLIEKAEAAVIRHGARVLLIDPWNEIEHARAGNETTTEYTNRAIMALKNFGRRFDVLIIVVAHPTKGGAAKPAADITLYDISDSAAFQNKADLGVIVARVGDEASTVTGLKISKIRYQPVAGEPGQVELGFDKDARLFH